MSGGLHSGHESPKAKELIWLATAFAVVLFAPNSWQIVSRLKPNAVWAWIIVLLFLFAVYHFDQTTEFLYYQF
jgi:hypothetical protein